MNDKIYLMDGAVGTTLWELAEENQIEKVPVWKYNIEHPELVEELHRRYVKAGSEMILANTFGANRFAVERSSSYSVTQVISAGMRIAKSVVEGTDVKVLAAAGPLTMLLEPFGDLTETQCAEAYREMLSIAVDQGADAIMLQTFMDLNMMKIAAQEAVKLGVPVYCTMTFEKVGKTMFGNSVEQVVNELTPLGIQAIGMNCSLGPDLALPIIEEFHKRTDLPLMFKPNAGKPILSADGSTASAYDASTFAKDISPALAYVNYVGGCCGSNDDYIKKLKEEIDQQSVERKGM